MMMNSFYPYYPTQMVPMLPMMGGHQRQGSPPHLSLPHRSDPHGQGIPTLHTYYDFLVVIDFEATCEETPKDVKLKPIRTERPEIIQFPAVLVDVRTMTIVDTFDSYVKPKESPILSEFCTKLTGITQDMVDQAPDFTTVLKRFEKWLKNHRLNNQSGQGQTFAIVTDGSYDMGHFLFKQCMISQLPFPSYARRWVNIRTIYWKTYKSRWFSLKSVLDKMGERFEGRQHNGLDDAKNISKVLINLMRDGGLVVQTEKVILDSRDQEKNESRILNDKRSSKFDLATVKMVFGSERLYVMIPSGNLHPVPPETDPLDLNYPTEVDNKENAPFKVGKKTSFERKSGLKNKRKLAKADYSLTLPSVVPVPVVDEE